MSYSYNVMYNAFKRLSRGLFGHRTGGDVPRHGGARVLSGRELTGIAMTTKEMNAAEHAQTARDFLVASDREFAAGDHLQGSEKLYGAATQAIIAICQQRGWRYKSHRAMQQAVDAMSREFDEPTLTGRVCCRQSFSRKFLP